jgi:chitodextrinase
VGKPTNCTINSVPCAGGPDLAPPSTPVNLRSSTAENLFTLSWGAATDNRGVVAYQIHSNGRQIAEVTGTSFSMPIPPPMVMTFGVRAVDAAGNLSPFAVLGLGTPTDVVAPTAPTQFTIKVQDGVLVFGWSASTDNVMVAGYKVSVNQAIQLVGGTSVKAVYRPGGVYQVLITAFDAAGNMSTSLVASFVVPFPTTPSPTHPIPSDPVPSVPVPSVPPTTHPIPSLPVPSLPVPSLPVPSLPVTAVPAA